MRALWASFSRIGRSIGWWSAEAPGGLAWAARRYDRPLVMFGRMRAAVSVRPLVGLCDAPAPRLRIRD